MVDGSKAYSGRAPSRLVHTVLAHRGAIPDYVAVITVSVPQWASGKRERLLEERGMVLTLVRGRDAGNARFGHDSLEVGPRLKTVEGWGV